jgi:rhomboid protease GluP
MPSKFNKKQPGLSSIKRNKSRLFSNYNLHTEDDFNWLAYKFTFICSGLLILIHLSVAFLYSGDILFSVPQQFVFDFAQNNYYVITLGEWFRLITAILIHGSIFHLAGNILFFVIFSIRLEELKGWLPTAIVFLVAGLAGNILTLFIFWNNIQLWTLGASGAVNGVFMANLVAMRKSYNKGALSALGFLIFFASFTIAGANSNFFSHLGGLIGGAVTMLIIEKFEKKNDYNISI